MDNLSLQGILCPILCNRYSSDNESIFHAIVLLALFGILLGAKSLVGLNKKLQRDAHYHYFNEENFEDFVMVIWLLQTKRNNFVHGNTLRMADAILEDAGRYLFEFQQAEKI
ncbi:hypothetical protein TorRG33x02_193170 [Trema orientale]|uniref:Uncharacterized protein n=1 Tax=Trema orientale TaxID=63057 RepID=A0A2P5EHB2_TREOI|nr:hypothetical protein TorRG33x02_193170 [Trema orientale]